MSDEVSNSGNVADFAPADITDTRQPGDWQTKYTDPIARRGIRVEAFFLTVHILLIPTIAIALPLLCADFFPESSPSPTQSTPRLSIRLLYAALGGMMGGTLFATKWLYHSVAKRIWHLDRRLWRLFTPWVSALFSFAFVSLMLSGLLVIIDTSALSSIWVCFAIGFLVGYFSDSAIAKLSETATVLFGTTSQTDITNDPR